MRTPLLTLLFAYAAVSAAGCKPKGDAADAGDAGPEVVDAAPAAPDADVLDAALPPTTTTDQDLPGAGAAGFEDTTAKKNIHPDNYKQELDKAATEVHAF